jgi:hypothetical protein
MHGQEFSMNNDAAHIFFVFFSPRAAVINKQFDMSDDAAWRQAEDAEVLCREVSCIR